MSARYDICSGSKDRDGKTRWIKLGAMFPAKSGEGFAIKLDALPIPNEKGEVWLSAFVPTDNAARQPMKSGARDVPRDEHGDDIPF